MAQDFSVMTATVKVSTEWQASQALSGITDSPNVAQASYDTKVEYTVGTGTSNISNPLVTVEEIAAGATETLDLFSLTAPPSNLNLNLSFATIKGIVIELIANSGSTAGSTGVRVGAAGSNRFDGWLSPGGWQDVDINGYPYVAGSPAGRVVNATTRNLQIANRDPANMATVRISIFGIKVGA